MTTASSAASTGGTTSGADTGHGDEVGDGDALRRDRRLRQDAEAAWRPPSSTGDGCSRRRAAPRPRFGLSSRARARSSVDLPHALAPTITVIFPVGSRRSGRPRPRPRRRPGAGARRPSVCASGARRCVTSSSHLVGPGEQPHRYGRADDAGDDTDRQLGRREDPPGDEVGEHTRSRPPSAAGTSVRLVRDEPAGDRRRDEGDERDRSGRGGGDGGQRDADDDQPDRAARPRTPSPWPCRRRAAGPAAVDEHQHGGHQHEQAIATGRTWSQPRPLRLPVSHTVARWASKISARVSRYGGDAREHRADADADQDEPIRRHPRF